MRANSIRTSDFRIVCSSRHCVVVRSAVPQHVSGHFRAAVISTVSQPVPGHFCAAVISTASQPVPGHFCAAVISTAPSRTRRHWHGEAATFAPRAVDCLPSRTCCGHCWVWQTSRAGYSKPSSSSAKRVRNQPGWLNYRRADSPGRYAPWCRATEKISRY